MYQSKASRLRVWVTAAATVALTVLTTTSAQAVQQMPENGEIGRIVNDRSGFCLEVNDGDPENGARAQQWACDEAAPWNRWRWEYVGEAIWWGWEGGGQVYRIRNAYTNKCLEVADSRLDNGAPVQQWACEPIDTQRWILDYEDWTWRTSTLVNLNSRKCLEIPDAGIGQNGALAHQWQCGDGIAQRWDY